MNKYIQIKLVINSNKTNVWQVINKKRNTIIGVIKWYGGFRKYCFFPESDMIFDWGCLRVIADFCKEKTEDHLYNNKA